MVKWMDKVKFGIEMVIITKVVGWTMKKVERVNIGLPVEIHSQELSKKDFKMDLEPILNIMEKILEETMLMVK